MTDTQSSGLVDALESLADTPPALRGPRCSVGLFLETADPAAAEALTRAMNNPAVPSSRIAAVLTSHECRVSSYTVSRHRRRSTPTGCRCPQ